MPANHPIAGSKNVFLNVPFDPSYERIFIALIASIVAARLVPRCAVELPERGEGQLKRIMRLLEDCQLSIHDLSRSERFNMPFELGLAVALSSRKRHQFILLESRRHRLARRLSDVRIEPLVHANSPRKLIAGLTENLDGSTPGQVEAICRKLHRVLPDLKTQLRVDSVFGKSAFQELVSGATELAEQSGAFR